MSTEEKELNTEERELNTNKVGVLKKWLKIAGISLTVIIMSICLGFYILIVSGLFPNIQELWVTTAMTTFSHKWLAEAFIDDETIKEIMERVYVDDTGYETDVSLIGGNKQQVVETLPIEEVEEDKESIPMIELQPAINKEGTYTEQGYTKMEDGIWFKEASGNGWRGYLLMVEDPSRVSIAQTRYQFSRGDLIKTLVPLHEARVGINAGGFVDGPNYDSNGGQPAGLLVVNGEIIQSNGSTKHSVIGFNEDNVLVLGKMTRQEVIEANIRDAVDFRPFLIVNGETVIKEGNGGWGIAPRTALGQRETGEVIFFCVDGRQVHSIGVDIRVLQDVLYEEGCINAAMVDGGSSTVMYHVEKGYLNNPSLGHERYINNCWLVK